MPPTHLSDHYSEKIHALSAELDQTILRRLDTPETQEKYRSERRGMAIEQKLHILQILEKNTITT